MEHTLIRNFYSDGIEIGTATTATDQEIDTEMKKPIGRIEEIDLGIGGDLEIETT